MEYNWEIEYQLYTIGAIITIYEDEGKWNFVVSTIGTSANPHFKGYPDVEAAKRAAEEWLEKYQEKMPFRHRSDPTITEE